VSAPPPVPGPPSATASAAPAPADGGAAEAAAPAQVPLAIQKVDEPAVSPLPHVEIKFPFAEQHIPLTKAARYRVRLEVQHWPMSGDKGGVELALDGFRPRRLETLERPVRLGELVPADQTLQPGEHVLVAIAVRVDGVTVKPGSGSSLEPFGAVHFWVGPRGTPSIDMKAPRLVYSEPRGTYNGARAADDALLDFYLLGADPGAGKGSVRATISGPGVDRRIVMKDWHARRIRGLPSGDYRVELVLLGADDKPLAGRGARVERTITVNRDAPDGGRYP
jgi:hypothetical protein